MIIATAGHVDHGKTTLLRALTGVDTDRLPEEKQRGMSIDLGFAYTDLGGQRVGFIDVPGHERFIRNMLAGVAGIDFALLVIAADDGIMPQTLEHLTILDLLGIRQGAVALSKSDRADPARLALVTREINAALDRTSLRGVPVFPVSAITGEGINDLRDYLAGAAEIVSGRSRSGNFRLAIDRCFSLRGAGVTVTGTVFAGRAAMGDTLIISPSGVRVRVRGIHANNQPAEQAGAGQRCAVNITASSGDTLDKGAIHRGDWLLAQDAHAPASRLDARIRLLDSETTALRHWSPVHVHIGASHMPGRIALLEGAGLQPGANALAQLVLDRPIGALRGDQVILRDASAQRTIGGGAVIDPFAPGKGRARSDRIAMLHALEMPSAPAALKEILSLSPGGADLQKFSRAFNLTAQEAEMLWQEVAMRRCGRVLDQTGISETHYTMLIQRVPELLAQWHRKYPQSLGPNEPELLRALSMPVSPVVLNAVIKQLVLPGNIRRSSTVLHLPGHMVTPSRKDQADWGKIIHLYDAASLTPPRIRELAAALDKPPGETEALLVRLAQAGLVTQVSKNRFFTPEILRAHAAFAEQAASERPIFTAQEFRVLSGIGRNLTIEVLEYFDRAGFTRRIQDGRMLRARAVDIFSA
ncbi:MAG: selenocysteine-specific translation elongation factor [Alphaproteobacteria bacterium]